MRVCYVMPCMELSLYACLEEVACSVVEEYGISGGVELMVGSSPMFLKSQQSDTSKFKQPIKKVFIGREGPTSRRKLSHPMQKFKHRHLSRK